MSAPDVHNYVRIEAHCAMWVKLKTVASKCNRLHITSLRWRLGLSDNDAVDDRKVITAKISRKSADGWRKFCVANGVTLTALIEIAGRDLAVETSPPTVAERRDMIERARVVDLARRSRRQ